MIDRSLDDYSVEHAQFLPFKTLKSSVYWINICIYNNSIICIFPKDQLHDIKYCNDQIKVTYMYTCQTCVYRVNGHPVPHISN